MKFKDIGPLIRDRSAQFRHQRSSGRTFVIRSLPQTRERRWQSTLPRLQYFPWKDLVSGVDGPFVGQFNAEIGTIQLGASYDLLQSVSRVVRGVQPRFAVASRVPPVRRLFPFLRGCRVSVHCAWCELYLLTVAVAKLPPPRDGDGVEPDGGTH